MVEMIAANKILQFSFITSSHVDDIVFSYAHFDIAPVASAAGIRLKSPATPSKGACRGGSKPFTRSWAPHTASINGQFRDLLGNAIGRGTPLVWCQSETILPINKEPTVTANASIAFRTSSGRVMFKRTVLLASALTPTRIATPSWSPRLPQPPPV